MTDRSQIADLIVQRLAPLKPDLTASFCEAGRIGSCQITDLLPDDLARAIHARFPASDRMVLKRSIKENKHVAAQMDAFDPLRHAQDVSSCASPRASAIVTDVTPTLNRRVSPRSMSMVEIASTGGPPIHSGDRHHCDLRYRGARRYTLEHQ